MHRLIIVGGGIVGCSVAYHLAKMGWKEVLVVDKGPLFENHGSTSHAPGGMHVVNPSRMMTDLAVYSTQLYGSLKPYEEGRPCFRPVGGIEVAHTQARWTDLKRKHGIATSYGVESHLWSPAQVADCVPILDSSVIRGGFYVPGDANVIGWHVSAALARDSGFEVREKTPVSGLLVEHGKVVGIRTPKGEERAERVLLCSNIWAPVLAATVGVELPLLAAQHQYAVTGPVAQLSEFKEREIVFPIMRHQDYSLYYRQHYDRWGIGNYRHRPLMVDPRKLGETAMMEFTPEDFEVARTATGELFPGTSKPNLERSFNGMFAFTIDGYPILGPTRVPGLWVGTGVWITHAGGVGRVLAEWLDGNCCSWDVAQADVARFHRHQTTRKYIQLRCAQNYREVYDVIHPVQPMSEPRGLRRAPYHHHLVDLGAHFFEAGGWEVPQWYESNAALLDEFQDRIPTRDEWSARHWSPIQGAEHLAVRARGGLFSLAALATLEVRGPGARPYLERMTANRLRSAPDAVTYSAFLNQNGGIRADLTLSEPEPGVFWVYTGGAILPRDMDWLRRHLPADGSVELIDRSSERVALGLWGPRARQVLSALTDHDLSNEAFPYYRAQWLQVGSIPVYAMRISYAGELGWELHTRTEFGLALWETLWPVAREQGMVAAGGGAFDSLRLEKGYRLWGADIDTEHHPFEAGLDFAVKLDQSDFIGRNALQNAKPRVKLCCLTLERGNLLGKEPVLHQGRKVGYVTSANYGYSVGKLIAYAYLPLELAQKGRALEVIYFGEGQPAVVDDDPLYDAQGLRMRA